MLNCRNKWSFHSNLKCILFCFQVLKVGENDHVSLRDSDSASGGKMLSECTLDSRCGTNESYRHLTYSVSMLKPYSNNSRITVSTTARSAALKMHR